MTNFMDISLYPEQHLNKKRIIMTLFQYGFNYPTKPPPHLINLVRRGFFMT